MLVLLTLLGSTSALYSKGGPVQQLSRKSFESVILNSDLPAVVEFYAPWCGHCKALAPAYQKVATNLEGLVNVAAVDCDAASNRQLCGEYGVQGFPTIKLFPSKADGNPNAKKRTKTARDYNGPRTAKGIADAATGALPDSFITRIQGLAGLDKFKSKSSLPKVILVSAKARSTPLYKSLSARFNQYLSFGEVKEADEAVRESLGVTESPQLLVLPSGDVAGEPLKYTGPLKPKELIAFLQQHAGEAAAEQPEAAGKKPADEAEAKEKAETEVAQVVKHVKVGEVKGLAEKEDALLLAFFGGNECHAEQAAGNKLVSELGGLVEAAAVNVSTAEEAQVTAWGVDGKQLQQKPCEAQLLLVPFGDSADSDEWQKYTGSPTAKELQKFITSSFPSRVPRLDAASIQAFLAIQPQVPKILLFTDKAETPALFAALAVNLRNRSLLFGDVHSSQAEAMQQFSVSKVPAMRLAFLPPAGATSASDDSAADKAARLAIQPFPGPFTYPAMAGFLSSFADMLGGAEAAAGAESAGSAAEVAQVNDQASLENACPESGGICVLGLLEAGSDSAASQIDILKAAAGKHAKHPLRFAWVDASTQGSFLSDFSVSASDAPTVVAFSAAKQRQARLRGSYTAEAIADMLTALLAGRYSTSPLQAVPKLVDGGESTTSGDQLEASPPVGQAKEEEFDLSDILGEDVGGSTGKADRLQEIEAEIEAEAEAARAQHQAPSHKSETKKKSKRKKKSKPAGSSKDEL